MDTLVILGIAAAVVVVILIVVLIVANKKWNKKKKTGIVDTKNARYTFDTNTTDADGNTKVSYTREDIMLAMGETYRVASNDKTAIKPGKYTVLSTDGGAAKFNMRIGSYVREYKHNQEIILADNTEITAISASVILR